LAAASKEADFTVVEADGSRRLPLKHPRPGEPALPDYAGRVMALYGSAGLGLPAGRGTFFNLEAATQAGILRPGETVSPGVFRRLVLASGLAETGRTRDVSVLIVGPDPSGEASLEEYGRAAFHPGFRRILTGSLRASPPDLRPLDNRTDRIAAVVLAAGKSERFGRPKLTAEVRGRSLIRRALCAASAPGYDLRVLVVGADADPLLASLEPGERKSFEVVRNDRFSQGISSSIRAGLASVKDRADAAAFFLADMPYVKPGLAGRVAMGYRAAACRIAAPRAGGRTGHPVIFRSDLFEELLKLKGDCGGREIVQGRPDWTVTVEDDPLSQIDVDTPADLDAPGPDG
jgi:molybdenum cofactor cytidylyltransferase